MVNQTTAEQRGISPHSMKVIQEVGSQVRLSTAMVHGSTGWVVQDEAPNNGENMQDRREKLTWLREELMLRSEKMK